MKRHGKDFLSLAAFVLILLFAGAADGIMETIGSFGFTVSAAAVLAVSYVLVRCEY